jgi:hypothetical protein
MTIPKNIIAPSPYKSIPNPNFIFMPSKSLTVRAAKDSEGKYYPKCLCMRESGIWAWVSVYHANSRISPETPHANGGFLIDTGANISMITEEIALFLNVQDSEITRGEVIGLSGAQDAEGVAIQVYVDEVDLRIVLPFAKITRGKELSDWKKLNGENGPIGVLGRDFLQHCKLVYDGKDGTAFLET